MKIKIYIIVFVLSVSTLQANILDLWDMLKAPKNKEVTAQTFKGWDAEVYEKWVSPKIVKNKLDAFFPLEIPLNGISKKKYQGDWVILSPNDEKIITMPPDITARIWDLKSEKQLKTLIGHTKPLTYAQFSPDGKRVVTASYDKTIIIWDTESGKKLLKKEVPNVVTHMKWSPDNTKIVSISGKIAEIWNVELDKIPHALTLKHKLMGHKDWIRWLDWSSDGTKIVTASKDKTAIIWNAESGKILHTLIGHANFINSVQFSQDSKRVVTASNDKTVRIWDAESGDMIFVKQLKGKGVEDSVKFSPDGEKIITASTNDENARMWDVESGKDLLILKGEANFVQWSLDGKKIFTASSYDKKLKIWDLKPFNKWLNRTLTKKQTLFVLILHKYRADMPPEMTITLNGIAQKYSEVTTKELTEIFKSFPQEIQDALKVKYYF